MNNLQFNYILLRFNGIFMILSKLKNFLPEIKLLRKSIIKMIKDESVNKRMSRPILFEILILPRLMCEFYGKIL